MANKKAGHKHSSLKDYPKASVWKRFFAYLLDGIFTGLLLLLLIVPGVVYWLIKDGLKNGQSWGCRIMGLKVVNLKTGAPCTKLQSVLRALFASLSPLWVIEAVLVVFESKGQRLVDKLMGTNVIEID